ncbi:MAG: hypothetical protein AAFP68_02720 [Pseudomonadota bacterium]
MVLRVLGLVLAAALAYSAWYAWENYGQFANVARWSGDRELRWLRGWLTEFRTVILCVAGFLALSALSWIWAKLKLGH